MSLTDHDKGKKKGSGAPMTEEQVTAKRAADAARKRRQRDRESAEVQAFVPGEACRVTLKLTGKESAYLARAMKIRAVWAPSNYDPQEYISTLLLRDGQLLDRQLAAIPPCEKCGLQLPQSCERLHKGEADCLLTTVALELKL